MNEIVQHAHSFQSRQEADIGCISLKLVVDNSDFAGFWWMDEYILGVGVLGLLVAPWFPHQGLAALQQHPSQCLT